MPLDETLFFDPEKTAQLGLEDCFTLRDVRYNQWASFIDYLIRKYDLAIIEDLWKAMPHDRRPFRPNRGSRTVPTVDYAGVLGKSFQQLEIEWLESLYMINAQ